MTKQMDGTSEHLLRELAPQVLGTVARRFRDFAAAEDAVQEAMVAAFTQWPQEGVPGNPRGWLIQVACRRMTDQVRSGIARRERETAVAAEAETLSPTFEINSDMDPDDTLILLFMCCHPALTPSSAIALTLRAVGGLTTAEIANAFLSPRPRWHKGSAARSKPSKLRAYRSVFLLRTSVLNGCPQFCMCCI